MSRQRDNLSAKRLKEVLRYSPSTGIFTWRSGHRCGRPAGTIKKPRRLYIGVDGRYYAAGRLAWLYVHGRWPAQRINHRDRDDLNNRLSNLREGSRAECSWTSRSPRNNKSGHKGVYFVKRVKAWRVSITVQHRRRSLGYYESRDEAISVYKAEAQKLRGEFANV